MCVVSLVMDHYTGPFDKWTLPNQDVPLQPYTIVQTSSSIDLTPHLEEIKQLIKDFRVAVEAAAKVDRLTSQPDCVDPEKVKLEARVTELEARIKDIEQKSVRKTKKRTKKGK